jgi:hypothetical protein
MSETRAPVETKVQAAAWWTLAASVGVALGNATLADSTILGPAPGWAQFLILAALPPVVTFLGGYAAPHSPRFPGGPPSATESAERARRGTLR